MQPSVNSKPIPVIRHDVRAFVDDPSAQTLSVGANISAIRFAFSYLKGLVVESRSRPGAGAGSEDVAKLQLQLQQVRVVGMIDVRLLTSPQRNTEIAILVNMLNKPGSSGVDALSIRTSCSFLQIGL
jgi:hypothetical protein